MNETNVKEKWNTSILVWKWMFYECWWQMIGDDDVRCYCYKWTWQPKTSSTNGTEVKHPFATNNMNKNKEKNKQKNLTQKMLLMKCNKRKKVIVLDLVGNVIEMKRKPLKKHSLRKQNNLQVFLFMTTLICSVSSQDTSTA